MEATIYATTFPLFPHLPAELRLLIWHNALPHHIPPALFLWKRGCWDIRLLTKYEYEYEPERDDLNLILEFRPDMLGPVRFNISLLSINSEARHIALTWAINNGIEIQHTESGDYSIIRRAFQPECDAIFVPLHGWELFLSEAVERAFEPDLIERNYSNRTEVYQIAVPEILLYRGTPIGFEDIFDSFPFLKALYVVIGPPPATTFSNRNEGVPWYWEINEAQNWEMVWTGNLEGDEDKWVVQGNKTYIIKETLYSSLVNASKELHEGLVNNSRPEFKIRIVHIEDNILI